MTERSPAEPADSLVDKAVEALEHADPQSREAEAADDIVYPADETNEG